MVFWWCCLEALFILVTILAFRLYEFPTRYISYLRDELYMFITRRKTYFSPYGFPMR